MEKQPQTNFKKSVFSDSNANFRVKVEYSKKQFENVRATKPKSTYIEIALKSKKC